MQINVWLSRISSAGIKKYLSQFKLVFRCYMDICIAKNFCSIVSSEGTFHYDVIMVMGFSPFGLINLHSHQLANTEKVLVVCAVRKLTDDDQRAYYDQLIFQCQNIIPNPYFILFLLIICFLVFYLLFYFPVST